MSKLNDYVVISFLSINKYQIKDPVSQSDKLFSRSEVLNYLAKSGLYFTMKDRNLLNNQLGILNAGFSLFIDLETKQTHILKSTGNVTSSDEIGWSVFKSLETPEDNKSSGINISGIINTMITSISKIF